MKEPTQKTTQSQPGAFFVTYRQGQLRRATTVIVSLLAQYSGYLWGKPIQRHCEANQNVFAGQRFVKALDNLYFAISPENMGRFGFWINEPRQPATVLHPHVKHFNLDRF